MKKTALWALNLTAVLAAFLATSAFAQTDTEQSAEEGEQEAPDASHPESDDDGEDEATEGHQRDDALQLLLGPGIDRGRRRHRAEAVVDAARSLERIIESGSERTTFLLVVRVGLPA